MSMQVYLTAVRLAWASMVARVRFGNSSPRRGRT